VRGDVSRPVHHTVVEGSGDELDQCDVDHCEALGWAGCGNDQVINPTDGVRANGAS
jgi:hypothetical protein